MPAAHTCSPSKMFYLWRWLKGSGDVRVPRAAGIIAITPQWIFSCCSGAASIFTNNLYFHITLLPGPSSELAPGGCKQGDRYRQGVKFGVLFPAFQCSQRGKFLCCVLTSCTLVMGGQQVCAVRAPWGHAAVSTSKHEQEFLFSSFKALKAEYFCL